MDHLVLGQDRYSSFESWAVAVDTHGTDPIPVQLSNPGTRHSVGRRPRDRRHQGFSTGFLELLYDADAGFHEAGGLLGLRLLAGHDAAPELEHALGRRQRTSQTRPTPANPRMT